jgi:hypothetical protein
MEAALSAVTLAPIKLHGVTVDKSNGSGVAVMLWRVF